MARLILHIGTHKTATTSIQKYLSEHREALAARGVFYPSYDLIGKKPHYAHLGMINALSGQHRSYTASDAKRFFREVVERSVDYDTTIISAEPIYRHVDAEGGAPNYAPETYWASRKAYIARLRDLFGPAEIVVVFRRQAEYAQSLYQEHVKVTRYRSPFREFLSDFWFHFVFADQVRAWADAFPVVRAMTFEKLTQTGDPVGEFARLLQLPVDGLAPARRFNEALPVDFVVMKRILQSVFPDGEDLRAKLEAIAASIGNDALKRVEPRSFFASQQARVKFQQQFDAENEALKPWLIQSFDEKESTFPTTYPEDSHFGDSIHPRVLGMVVTLAAEAAPQTSDTPEIGPGILPSPRRLQVGTRFSAHVFGDGSARLFHATRDCGPGRLGFDNKRLSLFGSHNLPVPIWAPDGRAALVAALSAAAHDTERLVLALGQADLELGYYRAVIENRHQSHDAQRHAMIVHDACAEVIAMAAKSGRPIAVRGANLTTLRDRALTARLVLRLLPMAGGEGSADRDALREAVLSEAQHNEMVMTFNSALRKTCEALGVGYFDLNAKLAARWTHERGWTLDPAYRPSAPDLHLADTIEVRRIHLASLLEVFGEDPTLYLADRLVAM